MGSPWGGREEDTRSPAGKHVLQGAEGRDDEG